MIIWTLIVYLSITRCGPRHWVADAFNIDVINYVRHEGQPDSMFGFSVALHQESQKSWVIIGAPQADTSSIQHNVRRGGAVYRCNASDDNRCQVIPFDSHGNQYNQNGEQVDTKSGQWFGATVSSAGIDGPLVACAPRYVFHSMEPRKAERVEPVGTCYLAKDNFQVYTEYSPCRTMFWGYHRQGSCQAGMSAALTKNGDRLFIGAPGSWYWQGQAYSINTEAVYPYKPPRYGQFGEGGQIYSFNLNNPRDRVWSTGESTATEDDSYLGYSAAVGDFNGDGSEDVALGMPRGGGLLGKVLLFSWNMTNIQNITGEQIGSYFGYSLCVVDVDGDKLDDLIIGAPMYTEPNNEGKYEMGRVYIMFQDKFNKFQTLTTRDGVNSKARFGLALTTLGDINLDGFGDFAVGAPYDGPSGRGAVYIYHGSPTGPLEKYSQVIYAEDLVGTGSLNTFGFSISGGIDLDGNMYPDLVVGAYESNKAIVLRSRPVAVMDASTVFESDSKLISLDDKNCTVGRDKKAVTCTSINSCLRYNGINLPPTVDIEVSWVLDTKKNRSPRLFFLYDEGKNVKNSTMRLYRGKTECRQEKVYITENIRDKLTPLEVEMKFNMRSYAPAQPALTRTRRAVLEPVLDMNKGTVKKDSINIQKNCGPDNICIPDLRLSVKSADKYLLGSKETLTIEILISNYGEDAFEAGFYMPFPPGLNFRKVEKIGDTRDTPVTCTAPSAETNRTLKCDVGNPLSSGKSANFKVIAVPSQKHSMAPSFDFYMEANSTNTEVEDSNFDNIVRKSIGIWVETDLSIRGVAHEAQFHYNVSEYVPIKNATKEIEIGPQVVTIYEIRNGGPSTIEEAEVYLLVPYETLAGDPLMYLLNQPETAGNLKCDPTLFANSRNLIIDQNLARKSYLESHGAIDRSSYSAQGIIVEQGTRGTFSHAGTSHGAGGKVYYTEEERRKLDAEENEESAGDASFTHRQRAGQASQAHWQAVQNRGHGAGQTQTYSSSWNTTSHDRNPTVTYTASRNRTITYNPDGTPNVVEYSTEGYYHGSQVTGGGIAAGHNAQTVSQTYRGGQNTQYRGSGSGTGIAAAAGSGTGTDFRQNVNNAGYLKVDDIPTVENVNQDISHTQYRNAATGAVGAQQTQSGTYTANGTGRRRMMSQQDGEPLRPNLVTGASQIEKIAQGGRGFQVGTLDLGINRGNVGEDLNRQSTGQTGGTYHATVNRNYSGGVSGGATASAGAGATGHQTVRYYSSGGAVTGGAVGGGAGGTTHQVQHEHRTHHIGGGGGGGATNTIATNEDYDNYADDVDEEYYEGDDDDNHQAAQQNQQTQQGHRNADNKFKHYHRLKRQANFNDLELEEALQCNTTRCAIIRCIAGPLETDSNAFISIRTRLVAYTMHAIAPSVPLNLSTMVVSRVSKLPYIGTPQEKPIKNHEVVITAMPTPEPKPDVVPLWVVVLSAVAGVIILLLLIYILYKCGFFNRNRPTDSQERQPLRNGVDHGDEHL